MWQLTTQMSGDRKVEEMWTQRRERKQNSRLERTKASGWAWRVGTLWRKSAGPKFGARSHLHDADEDEGDGGDGEHMARGHEESRAAAQLEDGHVAVERDEQHEERREAVQEVRERREQQRTESRQEVVDAAAEIPARAPVGEQHRERAVCEREREHQRVHEGDHRIHERCGRGPVAAAAERHAAHEVCRESEEHDRWAQVQRRAVVQQEHC